MSDGVEVARMAQVVTPINKSSVSLFLAWYFLVNLNTCLKTGFKFCKNFLSQSLFFGRCRLLFGLCYENLE